MPLLLVVCMALVAVIVGAVLLYDIAWVVKHERGSWSPR